MDDFKITITPPEEKETTNTPIKREEKDNTIFFESIEEEIKQLKKPREIYIREIGKINQYNAAFNKEMKELIENIHKIKKDIFEKKNQIQKIDGELNTLSEKQKNLIVTACKSDVIDSVAEKEISELVKEIEKKNKEKNELTANIKHLKEEELFNLQSKQLEILKEKKNTIELCLSNFELIKQNTEPLLSSLSDETKSIETLQKEVEQLKEKSNKNEEIKNKLKEEINHQLKQTYEYQENLLNECEKLRIALDEKMKQTIAVNQTITKATYYLQIIDKFGENYKEIDTKTNELKELKKKFDNKKEEYNDVLQRIETFNNKYTPINDDLEENISTMENFINIEIIQSEQIENYNKEIAKFREIINENEEKIEILDLENKALEAEISPLSLKISKFESEKKLNINKFKFTELPKLFEQINSLKNEKDKYQEKIKKVQENISHLEGENMKLLNEIENKTKLYVDIDSELRNEKVHYIKCFESVLNELPNHMKSEAIQEEIKFINDELEELNDEFREDNNTTQKKNTMRISAIEFKL